MAAEYAPSTNQNKDYVVPEFKKTGFNCPHCGIYAQQVWMLMHYKSAGSSLPFFPEFHAITLKYGDKEKPFHASLCARCGHVSLWCDTTMVYPDISAAPPPNEDLPTDAMKNYKEAASICSRSPRAAAAMLRLAVQDICVHLGGKGKNMQTDIDYLMKEKDLSKRLVKAMDAVRIVGNNAIHPGVMDLQDDIQTVQLLFGLVNRIATHLITEPRIDEEFYESLPDSQKRKDLPEK